MSYNLCILMVGLYPNYDYLNRCSNTLLHICLLKHRVRGKDDNTASRTRTATCPCRGPDILALGSLALGSDLWYL